MPDNDELFAERLHTTLRTVVEAALGKKAGDFVIFDLDGLADYCDRVVICSGNSDRQVRAIGQAVLDSAKNQLGFQPLGVEGLSSSSWVLVDLGDIVFHIFNGPARGYYDLEGLWPEAPRVSLESLDIEEGPAAEEDEDDGDFMFGGFVAPVA